MSYVQSVLFDRDVFSKADATKWLNKNGFISIKVDKTKNYYRFRQVSPIEGNDYRIKKVTPGIKFVLGFTQ